MQLLKKTDGVINWRDFQFKKGDWPDRELKAIEFVSDERIQDAWHGFWPRGRGVQTWDAVGQWENPAASELLLVEAKANLAEIASNCLAQSHGGRPKIEDALAKTKEAIGVATHRDWLTGYYQYANRLAALHFLHLHNIKTHLIFIYFTGDKSGPKRDCPITREEWADALAAQKLHLGLPEKHFLTPYVHTVFLSVGGP